jgi:hypothetical protein
MALTQAERITALEVKIEAMRIEQAATNAKLDSLLVLRNKGQGAFWLASFLFGTSLVGAFSMLSDWLRG